MAWMQCRSCSTKFAVGLLRCPQCRAVSEMYAVPEEVIEAEREAKGVPKISVEGGPSNALGEPVESESAAVEDAVHDEVPAVVEESVPVKAEESIPVEPEPGHDASVVEPAPTAAVAAPKAAKKTAKAAPAKA